MDLHADASLAFPCATVFAAYRDDMAKVLPHLPNVRSIEVESRTEDGSRVAIVNVWHGGGDVPTAVRAFLSESMLAWTDHAVWDAASLRCDWRIETHAFADAVYCRGQNSFVDQEARGTLLQMRGSLAIDSKKMRGVPGFLAGRIGAAIEEFLVSKIQSNFVETTRGMTAYLQDRARSAGT